MDLAHVQQAVEALQAQGVPLEAITAPMIREITGFGSYTSIITHLRGFRGEDAGVLDDPGEGEEPDTEELPPPGDPVREAEAALTQAKQTLQGKMDALHVAEAELAEARSRVIEAFGAKLAVMEGCRLGVFSGDDQARSHVEGEVQDASQGYRRPAWR